MSGALEKFEKQWGGYPALPQEVADAYNAGMEAGLKKALELVPPRQITGHNDEDLPNRNSPHTLRYWNECQRQTIENINKEIEK